MTVLDLTTFLSGPFATQLLADMGANVIKVEPPQGDSSRRIPPHFVDGDSAYFLAHNRNKRSVVLDLKNVRDVQRLSGMVAAADVVIENFRPGVTTRLGIDPEFYCKQYPSLVWASISGFGQTGARRDRPAYDMIVQALSGVMSLTGEPGRPAVRLGIPAGDVVAGMYSVIGLLALLTRVRSGGPGGQVDVSMLDSQLTMLSYQAVYSMISNTAPLPQGAGHDSIPTYRSFVGSDGHELVVTANTERMWTGLCDALELPELLSDTRYESGESRLKNKYTLWDVLEARFSERPAAAWVDSLVTNGVPAALIRSVPEALSDARESGRNMVVSVVDEKRGRYEAVASPVKFVGTVEVRPTFPPRLGDDTDAVLAEFGINVAMATVVADSQDRNES
ncbi:CaiB/BaiF CoA-transferase family protein [Cryobacterium sp. TMT1-2-2]|uniref:CaiB/BaiF CoA transferase family protein n=1 Tax=Cryobacterium sp. TMT1-2-2 TaxID=1259233 RepID=UPI0018E08D9A|nr:CoA transferase [Cryobacterium sp. TMT1-2-2]